MVISSEVEALERTQWRSAIRTCNRAERRRALPLQVDDAPIDQVERGLDAEV